MEVEDKRKLAFNGLTGILRLVTKTATYQYF